MISLRYICCWVLLAASLGVTYAQGGPAATPASEPPHYSLALSPAVVMLRGKAGQGATQTLTIANHLPGEMRFEIEVQDVVVKDGKREFVPAGQIPSSIASSTVAAPASVVAAPGQSMSVNVTLTVPPDSKQRAVVVFFRSKLPAAENATVGFGSSLGALITFNLSDDVKVVTGPISATPQTANANVNFSEELENTGAEPVLPKGVVAILDEHGKRVAKAAFGVQRLLPGEKAVFSVASPTILTPGRYRALSSFEFEGKLLTNVGEFTVSE
jgi:hypothetical protein